MSNFKVVLTDNGFTDVETERSLLEAEGAQLVVAQCKTPEEVIEIARDADALLVQWAPITAHVCGALTRCKAIVRYGIGVDNVDLAAAKTHGIPVCNVPDYGVNEVADHAMSLALALARQLPFVDKRLRGGEWKTTPVSSMPAFRESTFASAGFGRIGRAVLERARGFGFRLAAFDPFVDESTMAGAGVEKLSLDELFSQADILTLHLPLSDETRHTVDSNRLKTMKSHAILVNTARGALIDTRALAQALNDKTIASAGLDVYEEEPLAPDHPILKCENALLTSHVAWFSDSSGPLLQRLAAQEIVRALRGESLRSVVNR